MAAMKNIIIDWCEYMTMSTATPVSYTHLTLPTIYSV